MIALINGMVCECSERTEKDGTVTPVTYLYSHGETVRVPGLKVSSDSVGSMVDVLAEIRLGEFDGRKFLSIKPIN